MALNPVNDELTRSCMQLLQCDQILYLLFMRIQASSDDRHSRPTVIFIFTDFHNGTEDTSDEINH